MRWSNHGLWPGEGGTNNFVRVCRILSRTDARWHGKALIEGKCHVHDEFVAQGSLGPGWDPAEVFSVQQALRRRHVTEGMMAATVLGSEMTVRQNAANALYHSEKDDRANGCASEDSSVLRQHALDLDATCLNRLLPLDWLAVLRSVSK